MSGLRILEVGGPSEGAVEAATDDLLGRADPTGQDHRTKPILTNPATARHAAKRALKAAYVIDAAPEDPQ